MVTTQKNMLQLLRLLKRVIKNPVCLLRGGAKIFSYIRVRNWSAISKYLLLKTMCFDDFLECGYVPLCHYNQWHQHQEQLKPEQLAILKNNIELFAAKPLVSIVMLAHNSNSELLQQALQSIVEQIYSNWELCIISNASVQGIHVDVLKHFQQQENRIKIQFETMSQHTAIATNKAIDMATGSYIAFMGDDARLTADALYRMVEAINHHSNSKIFFSDEDSCDLSNKLLQPALKPGWNPFLLESFNYLGHFTIVEKTLLYQVGMLRQNFTGAEHYDLMLRLTEQLTDKQIVHVPYVIYHSRISIDEAVINQKISQNSLKALQQHLNRLHINAEAVISTQHAMLHKVNYLLSHDAPLVSIIIPTRDKVRLLQTCINSIIIKTHYKNYEIIVIDNGSKQKSTLRYLRQLAERDNVRVYQKDIPFNHSVLTNFGVKKARGEYVCFLNNDTKIITPSWLEELLGIMQRDKVAVVGAKLLFKNNTIQHAGIALGLFGIAGHVMHAHAATSAGYLFNLHATMNYSAVTAACCLVDKVIFNQLQGFYEKLESHYNDVDFCLRVVKAGYQVVFTPHAELYHHESATRLAIKDDQQNYQRAKQILLNRHGDVINNDPYYHPSFSRLTSNCDLHINLQHAFNKKFLYKKTEA
jgi:glycosyltransferase involved in cell wall biosynthesis